MISPMEASIFKSAILSSGVSDWVMIASQALATLRDLSLPDDAEHVNPNGGAIALGHPLGMSGARIAGTAALELKERNARRAIAAMCIGVGQGIAIAIEAV